MEDIRTIYYYLKKERSRRKKNNDLIKLLEADIEYKIKQPNNISNNMVKPKAINIFIASQDILINERDYIERMIRKENDKFYKKGFYLEPHRWENEDKGWGVKRKQGEINEMVKNADILILLMWTSIGKFTKEEFELAYHNMYKIDKPVRIYAFNNINERTPLEDEIKYGSVANFYDLVKKLWKDEKMIIKFKDNETLKKELDNMFEFINQKFCK